MTDFSSIRADLDALQKQARQKMGLVIFSFIGFCLLYLFVLLAAAAGTWLVFTRFYLVLRGGLWGILLFALLGFLTLGILIIVLRFLFVSRREEDPASVEINETVYPGLMKFIYQVCDELNAPRPYAVYVSPVINAYVSGHRGLKGYLRPKEKKLTIGYPLILFLTQSELKATLAHEFAHFTNDSMVPGTFLDRIHRGLHKMVYTQGHVEEWATSMVRSGGSIGMAGNIIWSVIGFVRKIFGEAYERMHMRYMAMSRLREFMADKMAAAVAGSDPLCNGLRKLDFIQSVSLSLDSDLGRLMNTEKKLPRDYWSLMADFISVRLKSLGLSGDISKADLPEEYFRILEAPGRIQVEEIWQAHPSFAERKQSVSGIHAPALLNQERALLLADNRDKLEEKLTTLQFRDLIAVNHAAWTNDPGLNEVLVANYSRRIAHPRYKGYFDFRFLFLSENFEVASPETPVPDAPVNENDLELITWFSGFRRDEAALLNLMSIQNHDYVRFEFDGKKCRYADLEDCRKELIRNENEMILRLSDNDEKKINWHYYFADTNAREKLKIISALWTKINKLRVICSQQLPAFEHWSMLMRANKEHINDILLQVRETILEFEAQRLSDFDPVYNYSFSVLPSEISAVVQKLNHLRQQAPERVLAGRYNLAKYNAIHNYTSVLCEELHFATLEVQCYLFAVMSEIASAAGK